MAERKALVLLDNGFCGQLPQGDTLASVSSVLSGGPYIQIPSDWGVSGVQGVGAVNQIRTQLLRIPDSILVASLEFSVASGATASTWVGIGFYAVNFPVVIAPSGTATVNDAGTIATRGAYVNDGSNYIGPNNFKMHWTGTEWTIYTGLGTNYYSAPGVAGTVPTSGWTVVAGNGTAPAPTVSTPAPTSVNLIGQSGAVSTATVGVKTQPIATPFIVPRGFVLCAYTLNSATPKLQGIVHHQPDGTGTLNAGAPFPFEATVGGGNAGVLPGTLNLGDLVAVPGGSSTTGFPKIKLQS